jgi:hypothetical protein
MKAMGEQRWFGWVRRLIGYEPIRHGRLEMGLLRAAFAWVLAAGVHVHASGLKAQPRPHGFGRWMDFTFAGDPAWFEPMLAGCFVAIGLFACGWVPLVALQWELWGSEQVQSLEQLSAHFLPEVVMQLGSCLEETKAVVTETNL